MSELAAIREWAEGDRVNYYADPFKVYKDVRKLLALLDKGAEIVEEIEEWTDWKENETKFQRGQRLLRIRNIIQQENAKWLKAVRG